MPDRVLGDMPDRMLEDMPDRMPEGMPDRMPDKMSDRMPEDMPDKVPECLPDNMPDRMPDGMPEDMPEHMPEDMPGKMSSRPCATSFKAGHVSWLCKTLLSSGTSLSNSDWRSPAQLGHWRWVNLCPARTKAQFTWCMRVVPGATITGVNTWASGCIASSSALKACITSSLPLTLSHSLWPASAASLGWSRRIHTPSPSFASAARRFASNNMYKCHGGDHTK